MHVHVAVADERHIEVIASACCGTAGRLTICGAKRQAAGSPSSDAGLGSRTRHRPFCIGLILHATGRADNGSK